MPTGANVITSPYLTTRLRAIWRTLRCRRRTRPAAPAPGAVTVRYELGTTTGPADPGRAAAVRCRRHGQPSSSPGLSWRIRAGRATARRGAGRDCSARLGRADAGLLAVGDGIHRAPDLRPFLGPDAGGDAGGMTEPAISSESLLKVRKGAVEFVDVPEFGFAVVTGTGAPGGAEFTQALQALYSVSYGAHFLAKKQRGQAPRVMPLEALWWVDDPGQQDIVAAVALGQATMADTDRDRWRWQAMIMQPDPIDADMVAAALAQARAKKPAPGLEQLCYQRWAEHRCAQLLHVGPYADEGPSIVRLHQAIAAAGYRPRGRHHEIYLGDPRRSAPGKLRTILRHPIEPQPV